MKVAQFYFSDIGVTLTLNHLAVLFISQQFLYKYFFNVGCDRLKKSNHIGLLKYISMNEEIY